MYIGCYAGLLDSPPPPNWTKPQFNNTPGQMLLGFSGGPEIGIFLPLANQGIIEFRKD